MKNEIAVVAAATVIVLAVIGLVYPRLPGETMSLPDRQGHLPGQTAVLYQNSDDAAAACGYERVVFADAKTLAYVPQRAQQASLPDFGFGCITDLEADGFHHA